MVTSTMWTLLKTRMTTISSCQRPTSTMWANKLLHLQKRLKPLVTSNFLTLPGRSCSSMPDVRDFIGRGLAAVTEVERILPYTDFQDHRLQPLLKTAKENFELALEVEKENADAMLWLARLHLYYNIPQACLRSGAVLLETAAESGHAEAQYELACRIRAEGALLGDDDAMDDRVFNYLESAACQKHAGALFLVGAIYLSGKHVRRNPKAAAWCFRKAAEQGHIPAATVYGSLITKGGNWEETKAIGVNETDIDQPIELDASARAHFEKASEAGDPLAHEWLTRTAHEPKSTLLS